jgi:tRNA modification GTPase
MLLDCWPSAWGLHPGPASGVCRRILVSTRCDEAASIAASDSLATSAVTGAGLDELRSAVAGALRAGDSEGNLPAGTAARCRGRIHRAGAALHSASESLLAGGGDELVAFDVRLAAEELGKVVGSVVTDDILDRIFRRFCIGK